MLVPLFNLLNLLCLSFRQFSLTPLHLACWYGQESVVKLLLECGANVNAEDRVSWISRWLNVCGLEKRGWVSNKLCCCNLGEQDLWFINWDLTYWLSLTHYNVKVTFYIKNTGLVKTQFVTPRYISNSIYISSLLCMKIIFKKVKKVKKVCLATNFHVSETLLMVIWLHIKKTIKLALFLILIKLPVLVV